MTIIDDVFRPIYGKPCWNFEQGYSSFLTLEFGEPHLHITEPHQPSDEAPESVRRNAPRRFIYVRGDWHLWIYLADWRLSLRGQELAKHNSTRRVIKKALIELDGQALTRAGLSDSLASTFDFDLGGRLEVVPNPKEYNTTSDLWTLFEPSGDVFSFRGDGQYCRMPEDTNPADYVWHPIVNPKS